MGHIYVGLLLAALSRALFGLLLRQGCQFIQSVVNGFLTDGNRVAGVRTDFDLACYQFFITAC